MPDMPIDRLQFDEQLWPRVQRDAARVAHLADVLISGGRLPAVKVQRGSGLVLGGWHTVAAYQCLERSVVPVELVDIPASEQLLYAYREDVTSALPYSDADVRSVARRLYGQRSASNGELPNVTTLARDLGRSQRTVARWVDDLVAKKQAAVDLKRQARELAVQAFRATGLATRRIAALLGVSQAQVNSDSQVANAVHLSDSAIVAEAQSAIHLALGQGATVAEMEAARDRG